MTDKEYRKEDRLSYSAVKAFDTDRIKYYKKYELKDKSIEEEMSTDMKLGSLVDCKLFSPEEFDSRFSVATCLAPTGQMGLFTERLCNLTMQSLDADLKVTRDLTEMMEEAFKDVKYDRAGNEVNFKKKDFKYLLDNFIGSEAEVYYKDCRSQFGKIIIDMNLVNAGEKIIQELRDCQWTKDWMNLKTTEGLEVIDQLGLFFDVEGTPFKGMPDRVVINHTDKEIIVGILKFPSKSITVYDLKVTYIGEDFAYNYWKMKYYLQVGSYYLGIHDYKTRVRPELKDYTVSGIEFLAASSNLNSNPLWFSTNQVNINEGLMGFVTKGGRKYKGLYELIREIKWHRKSQLWRNSKEVFDNSGKMVIKPFED